MARRESASAVRARFQDLVAELRRLLVAFPDLHDAVDEDDLPIRFLIRRDAVRARDLQARTAEAAEREPATPARSGRKAGRDRVAGAGSRRAAGTRKK